jgi:hypothetical protein
MEKAGKNAEGQRWNDFRKQREHRINENGGQIELVVLDGLSRKLCCLVRNMLLILSGRAIRSDHDPAVGS